MNGNKHIYTIIQKRKTVIQNKFFENVTSYHIKQIHVIDEYSGLINIHIYDFIQEEIQPSSPSAMSQRYLSTPVIHHLQSALLSPSSVV